VIKIVFMRLLYLGFLQADNLRVIFLQKCHSRRSSHVSFYDPDFDNHKAKGDLQSERIKQFFRILALCHDTIPERIDGKIKLSASNPDDEALVDAAAYFGAAFLDRRESFAILNIDGQDTEVEVLEVMGFSSDRKRMSVVVRDPDGVLRLVIKGADSVMLHRISPGQESLLDTTNTHMAQYSQEGLRCLLVGIKEIDPAYYEEWSARYNQHSTDLAQLDLRKKEAGLAVKTNLIDATEDEMEMGLTLVGCTAIEDKLQDGVPECIAQLAKAGINIWVLTGDKEETAINIAVACNLVLPKQYMKHVIVNHKIAPTIDACMNLLTNETDVRTLCMVTFLVNT
jgi:magnesium-transporting ATPase (P-type)